MNDLSANKILVTGGAGYIGTHTCVELIEAGHEVIVFDNLCNSKAEALLGVERITGVRPELVVADLRDLPALIETFEKHEPDAVIHFAGLKAVGESVNHPLRYFQNNVAGSINLFEAMRKANVKKLVFSSSCTVYGSPKTLPIDENAPVGNTSNPYGHTKYMIEQILRELHQCNPDWNISILRYFNPVGAHASGEIGEDPHGVPENLMPYVCQVAVGKHDRVRVWGNDYDTPDGTGVRDYLHVSDLATGHLSALNKLDSNPGLMFHNLGTGNGYSVLDVIEAFRSASGQDINYEIMPRRPGDIAAVWADTSLAEKELGWKAERGLEEMCRDAWSWQKNHLNGF
ncbi:MAG: UDP-glucose 4-epimerase GalE [Xanthomonadales bacterium]|nr:UDP-glucose 4-epimerase GalE [Xanthomonadales bacterium]